MADKLRILIADDVAFFRRVVADVLRTLPDVELVASVENGRRALDRISEGDIQLAILDIEMPELDGLSAAREIARLHPSVQVAILSGAASARRTMEALANGAIELIRKPDGADAQVRLRKSLERVIDSARAVRTAQERQKARTVLPIAAIPLTLASPEAARPRVRKLPRKFDLVLIGVSTGGPKALLQLIPSLPADLPCPLLVVQHLSAGFTASLAESLSRTSKLPVTEAADSETITPGRVMFAPGGVHMQLAEGVSGAAPTVRLTETPPVNGCRPSVDVLWNSVAANFHGEVLGVVLTGMGRDGRDGMMALRARGAHCIAQDEATSVVWGMPGAVVDAGLADEVLPLDAIAARIELLVMHRIANPARTEADRRREVALRAQAPL